MLTIAALILTLLAFNVCFFAWVWWTTRSGKKGGDDSTDGCGCPMRETPACDKKSPEDLGANRSDRAFIIKPYLQLGTAFSGAGRSGNSLEILWNAVDEPEANWEVRVTRHSDGCMEHAWVKPETTPVEFPGSDLPRHKQFRARVENLQAGEHFQYEVFKNAESVFAAHSKGLKGGDQSYRFIIVGDSGHGKPGQKKVAHQMNKFDPDFIVMPGDIAYKRGLFSENAVYHFPVFNSDVDQPDSGAPLLRSVPTIACPGNHDFGRPDLGDIASFNEFPDLYAYFHLWSLPLNGPDLKSSRSEQRLLGVSSRQRAFLTAAAGRWPNMANFSCDLGNSHFTVLDANSHMDWSEPSLRAWLENDLSQSKAVWKWVVLHQPPFTCHTRHGREQRMRQVVPIFEKNGVDITVCGHAHWYERLFPLKFKPAQLRNGVPTMAAGLVDGEVTLDKSFDGKTNTRPNGILYFVSGAGGAKLHGVDAPPSGGHAFTDKLIGDLHSFTVVDVDGRKLTVRQISEDGEELDNFTVTK